MFTLQSTTTEQQSKRSNKVKRSDNGIDAEMRMWLPFGTRFQKAVYSLTDLARYCGSINMDE